jgi:predicted nucleic acid-binding protein
MRYLDTSVVLALLLPEEASLVAEAFVRSEGPDCGISSWTEVELLSALGIKLRSGQLSRKEANFAAAVYTNELAPALRRIDIHEGHHRLATLLLDGWRTALRSGDALHLAIAALNDSVICTFDKTLAKSAKFLHLPVTLVK